MKGEQQEEPRSEGRWRGSLQQAPADTSAGWWTTELRSSDEVREHFQRQDAQKDLEDPLQTFLLPTVLGYGNTLQLGCLLCQIARFFKGNNLFTGDRGKERLGFCDSGFCRRNEHILQPEDVHKFTLATGCADKPVIFLDSALGASGMILKMVLCSPNQQSGPTVAGCGFNALSSFDGGSKKWYVADTS